MSALADRLRGLIGGAAVAPGSHGSVVGDLPGDRDLESRPGRADAAGDPPTASRQDAADVLEGEWHERRGQRFLVVDRKFGPGHRHGRASVADGLPPSAGLWPRLSLLAGCDSPGNLLFLDLETTGLAGGAGTYAFLVGCAWFDGATFRVRQLLLTTIAAERALLDAVTELADGSGTVVTYNGKSFDLPLIETRFLFHRMDTPFAGVPHIDMLHPARQLWSDRGGDSSPVPRSPGAGGCRLSVLEQNLCGHLREFDVPGFEIPSRYFQYVRNGDARPLRAVLEHNRLDLLSLALVTARAAQLLDEGPSGATTAREALGLGRLYERAGLDDLAGDCFSRAAGIAGGLAGEGMARAEGLRAYALLSRRERRYEDAAIAWRRLIELRTCPPHMVREATEALAVHHEHRLRDPLAARAFALQSMRYQATRTRQQALQHRLTRLNRKLGVAEQDAALF
jgi:uncharacterized protein YprB with RNaseH-like and TPR domain